MNNLSYMFMLQTWKFFKILKEISHKVKHCKSVRYFFINRENSFLKLIFLPSLIKGVSWSYNYLGFILLEPMFDSLYILYKTSIPSRFSNMPTQRYILFIFNPLTWPCLYMFTCFCFPFSPQKINSLFLHSIIFFF